MRASLDTNVIIHFYKAGLENILFNFFDEGVFIYEQIRNIELENHGQEVLNKVDSDIASGKIELYTDQKLKDLQIYIIDEMLLHYDKKQAKLEGNSIGILNVQKRIKLLCGPKYGLSYMENETGGVTARLLLPHEEDAK